VRSEATTARVPAWRFAIVAQTARPEPNPMIPSLGTSSAAAAAAASRAAERSVTGGSFAGASEDRGQQAWVGRFTGASGIEDAWPNHAYTYLS
jgi:hypothetical protein